MAAVGWEQLKYNISEADAFARVCVVTGPLERTVLVTAFTLNNTANG